MELQDQSESVNAAKASLQETSGKVQAALLPAIETYTNNEEFSQKDGLDFLSVKNSLLLSYVIELVTYIRDKNKGAVDDTNIKRLNEMKVVLDKMRGLDKKLRYQIDKLLATNTSATSFASAGDNAPQDPLQFKPDPKAFDDEYADHDDDDDDDDDDNNHQRGDDDSESAGGDDSQDAENAGDDSDGDDDLKAARATLSLAKERKQNASNEENDGVYKAPRQTAVPYTFDQEQKQKEKEKRLRKRMRSTELAQTLRAQYGENPEQEDIHGGSDYGKQREAARRLAERQAAKQKYEEETMVRLQESRKDKKERKRLMRQEGSNLSAIADLGNLVRETKAFGRDDESDDDRMPESRPQGGRYENGKRKREAVNVDGRTGGRKGKIGKPKNALQAALYNSEGRGKSKKNRR